MGFRGRVAGDVDDGINAASVVGVKDGVVDMIPGGFFKVGIERNDDGFRKP